MTTPGDAEYWGPDGLHRSAAAPRLVCSRLRKASVLLAGALVSLSAAAAARETFDIATFEAPPGWERVASPGLLLLRAPAGDGQLALFSSTRSDQTPSDSFAAEWARLVTGALGPVGMPQLATQQTADGWTAVFGAINVTRDGAALAVIQVTTTGFGRTMSVVANLAGERYVAEVTRFFETFELRADAPAPVARDEVAPVTTPAAPRAGADGGVLSIAESGFAAGRPVGLFYRLNVSMTGSARIELETRLFLPGDRITRTFPFGGGDRFDSGRCLPATCGSYRLDGGTLSITWDDGRSDRWSFARDGGELRLDGTTFRPARALSADTLAGHWSGAQTVGDPASNVFEFERDGAFTFGTATRSIAGRYRLQGLTLTLDFADGSTKRSTLFAAGTSEPVGLITVDGDVYSRR